MIVWIGSRQKKEKKTVLEDVERVEHTPNVSIWKSEIVKFKFIN